MFKLLIQGIIIILLWVGAWGILEMCIDSISGDNRQVRFVTYFFCILLGLMLLWIATIAIDDD
jgi:hypothetical protein